MRQNAFNTIRFANFSLTFHWLFIILHSIFVIGSVALLVVSWNEVHSTARPLRIFIGFMALTSVARIFRSIYDRRWPLTSTTEWGTEVIRPVSTFAGRLAVFIHQNVDLSCFLASIIIMLFLDKQSSEEAEKQIPYLFWTGMFWAMVYLLYFVAPIFLILGLIACLPCIILILQRFFNFSLMDPNEGSRAAPATQAVLEKIWKVKYRPDESFKYINPEDPEQTVFIAKEDTKCSICLNWYEDGDELRILPCAHHFHLLCADEWFKITATCPLCVRPIRSTSPSTADLPNPVDANV